MGIDAQKSFTEMDEDGDMENGVWGKIYKVNVVVVKKAAEEGV